MIYSSTYKVGGTRTYRLASAKLIDIFGGNSQQIPDVMRKAFIPRPGNVFVQCDLEGAEAVAVALLCAEGNFRELVRRKVKIHNYLCVKLFPDKFTEFFTFDQVQSLTPVMFHEHARYKELVKHCKNLKVEYDLAKRTVHGSNYGMAYKTFQKTVMKGTEGKVVLPAAECKRLLKVYKDVFPELEAFQLTAEHAVRHSLPIYNLFGNSITFIQRFTDALARTGISWAPQSTVGICGVLAALRLQEIIEAEARKWNILTITHDSNLAECPAEEGLLLAETMAKCMTFEFTSPIDGWKCTIGVEKQVGSNWAKHSSENPNGLKVI
jgi:hypothetical protein